MSLLSKLKAFWYDQWDIEPKVARISDDTLRDIIHTVEQTNSKLLKSGIVKTQSKQFNIEEKRTGGRIVKTMPRQLRKMKELAEKTDD